ncbi:MAG: magnesium/cobalt transporter CorA [Gammaproteobacteria bacterium]|nr:magnesium/cobalt transporter CorA [Gammaproteobacteria bacterium]
MAESLTNTAQKAGMSPGTLVHVGSVHDIEPAMWLIDYSKDNVEKRAIASVDDIRHHIDSDTVTWLTIEGLSNVTLIESVGQLLNIHPLVLEDILNTHQRPKFEEHDSYLYIVLKRLSLESGHFAVNYEQISILVRDNFVVTFKENNDEIFTPLQQRLMNGKWRIRNQGADYLTYTILDTIVDGMFIILDSIDENIESTEETLLSNPTTESLATIQRLKRELIYIRKAISPLRDLLSAIPRTDSSIIGEKTHLYFSDVHDHVLRITESIDSHRDMLTGLLDIYISSVSNRMNEIMKVLTVFASIFIPLTFIAGIYGMNFEYMPELSWRWAYPALWLLFVLIPIALIIYFKRKKWL